jgi:putative nucleotidyltransferase with HDIG domain
MSNDIDNLLNQIEVLPAAPSMVVKLLPKLNDVDGHFEEIIDLIELDPGLTMNLLQICNSAFFGQAEPIVTVQDAVTRVGYQAIYLLAATISGAGSFSDAPAASIDSNRLWAHSVTAAFSTKYIAESTQQDANLLFTAGLLHDVGKIVLSQVKPGVYGDKFYGLTEAGDPAREMDIFGCTHAEAGSLLMNRWGLPDKLITAVSNHHAPAADGAEPLAACLELGDMFSHGVTDRKVLASPLFFNRLNAMQAGPQATPLWLNKLQANQQIIDAMSQLKAIGTPAKN